MNELHIEVKALDKPYGYLVQVIGIVDGTRTKLQEHYATEQNVVQRLATVWQAWAAQVDSE